MCGVTRAPFNSNRSSCGIEVVVPFFFYPKFEHARMCSVPINRLYRCLRQLLILNVSGGYHVLLAGMERISVDLGQFVVTGEPVAVTGDRAQSAVAQAGGANQPVLYVEFRKDGVPVDPGPWWAVNEGQKVRG